MENCRQLPPIGVRREDVIMGVQWLHSLGVTEVDWRKLVMTFQHERKTIVIKGDPSFTKTRESLKTMMKAWATND